MLNESLGVSDLSGSPMCINTMKVLTYICDNDGITLTKSEASYRKFVTWAAEEFGWPGFEAEELYRLNRVLNEPDFPPLAIMHELLVGSRLIRHYKSKALLSQAGKAMLGDYGALQAELFDTFFIAFDHAGHERFPIEYEEADVVHFLGVIQNRLDGWVPLTELAGWCLPLDLITSYRFSPVQDASFYLFSHLVRPLLWLGMIEEHNVEDKRLRIEDRRYRKTPLFDRFLSFWLIRDGGATIH
ncbi:hypothetical protein [Allomesorhizobium camelthorni]|uniref:Uncharacterized protein n=1 Tax=Allomesorhizobium camelthorni TaxID=475069 RepID=A0A6G4W6G2_9HYPH|nr:hypothetical protein [Mesorhizobium camelthorni]NGO49760.1 hypothetical protein [Mesorhizobium camelthorni]